MTLFYGLVTFTVTWWVLDRVRMYFVRRGLDDA